MRGSPFCVRLREDLGMRVIAGALLLVGMSLFLQPASAQAMRLDGWWIVLTSIRNDGTQRPHHQMEAFRRQMRPCGIDIFNDNSEKFVGFAPGLLVAAVGAYPNEAAARAQLPRVEPCAKGAYVKRARHTGE